MATVGLHLEGEMIVEAGPGFLLFGLLSAVLALAIPVAIIWLIVILIRRSGGGAPLRPCCRPTSLPVCWGRDQRGRVRASDAPPRLRTSAVAASSRPCAPGGWMRESGHHARGITAGP